MNELKSITFLRLGEITTVCFIVTENGQESAGNFINTTNETKEDTETQALKDALANLVSHYKQEGESE